MSRRRILLIDDELVPGADPGEGNYMWYYVQALRDAGFEVEEAISVDSALSYLDRGSATLDLIILDVMMNTLREGFLLSRELKKHPVYKAIPILMVTAVKEKVGIDFKPAAGDEDWLPVEDYLDKPVKPEVLLEKVKNLIQKT